MAKIHEFNGNDYVEMTLEHNQIDCRDMDNILNFINSHQSVYLYGAGLCGQGFMEYSNTCEWKNVKGFITSESVRSFVTKYKKGIDGIVLTLKSDYYAEILPYLLSYVQIEDILFLREHSKKIFINTFSKEYFENKCWLTIPITKHCNVNCASCNMFSPLCERTFYTMNNVKKDLQRLNYINYRFNRINITGGEPFLNPEAIEIIELIRSLYPKLQIDIYTTGFVLANYLDEQIHKLRECNVKIQITDYRLCVSKLADTFERLDKEGIDYTVDGVEDKKLFYKKTIDFSRNVPNYEYINCQYYTFCFSTFLFNGKVYKCPMAMNNESINKYSEKKIELTDRDYLILDQLTSENEIYQFWKSRLPMCSYCPRVTDTITWKKSERKIEEWM